VNWERWARASGIGFVVLIVVSFVVFGEQPKLDAQPNEIADFYDGDRGRILTAVPIFAVAFVLFLWFVGAIANALREAGEGRLGATTVALGAVFAGVQFLVGAISASLALTLAAAGDEGTLRALNTMSWSLDALNSFVVAAFVGAVTVGLRRAALVPPWFAWVGLAAALIVVLRGTNWARDGFWSPSGEYGWIAIVAGLAWVLTTSILLLRGTPAREGTPERTAATPVT
jgi:hypothetical protein